MLEQSTTVTREQLHELVWKTPMIRLGKRLGISDNGLRKICRRCDIPTPPAGWWAKKAAGHRVKVTPLPAARPGIPLRAIIAPAPPETDAIKNAIRSRQETVGAVAIPDRLVRPHPIVAKWIEAHRRRQEDARQQRRTRPHISFSVPDFSDTERRRHRILHGLFRALEQHGVKVVENDRRRLFTKVCDEEIEFGLHEKSRHVVRPLPDDERRWGFWERAGVRRQLQPTGRLEFRIRAGTDQPIRKVWLETEKRSLETMLPDIVATFLVLAPLLAERTRKREEEARLWAERQRELELKRQLKQQDDNRWARFLAIASEWQQAELARAFIRRLRELDQLDGNPTGARTPGEWLHWAEAKIEEFDPVGQGLDWICQEVARVQSWTYRE